ncbi:hypothetical protein QNN88_14190 [Citrobacter sp. ANG330]|uniref:hypothetical protein n=1 Tax=Citrobacter sp. ANG330 TaxID=3048142 RepID=UPI0039C2B8C2
MNIENDEQYRRELIYRKGNSKAIINKYRKKISSLVNIDESKIKTLSLRSTDKIIDSQKKQRRMCGKEKCPPDKIGHLLEIECSLPGGYYVFIDNDWKYCGCFFVNSLSVLNKDFTFGNDIVNGIFFISEDLCHLIDLDYYEEGSFFYIEKTTFEII